MLTRVVDNFNVSLAAVIQQRRAWIEHGMNYLFCDFENGSILVRFAQTKSMTLYLCGIKCAIKYILVIAQQNVNTFMGHLANAIDCAWLLISVDSSIRRAKIAVFVKKIS